VVFINIIRTISFIICVFAFVTICMRFCIVSTLCVFACIEFLY
jgi:hypothetical protein